MDHIVEYSLMAANHYHTLHLFPTNKDLQLLLGEDLNLIGHTLLATPNTFFPIWGFIHNVRDNETSTYLYNNMMLSTLDINLHDFIFYFTENVSYQ